MIDLEVVRLRKLRDSALRVRAVARGLSKTRAVLDDPLLNEAACAAWRVARAVTGRLRAHPYMNFQRDAGLGSAVTNAVVAACAAFGARSRERAFRGFIRELREMSRELEDARSLTWVPELSESFGRSLSEFRPLLAKVYKESRPTPRHSQTRRLRPSAQAVTFVAREGGWPYLAL